MQIILKIIRVVRKPGSIAELVDVRSAYPCSSLTRLLSGDLFRSWSSSAVHAALLTLGQTWLNHLRAHARQRVLWVLGTRWS